MTISNSSRVILKEFKNNGILMPLLANHFVLDIPVLGSNNFLMKSALKVEINLIKKQITCYIEQSVACYEFIEIQKLIHGGRFTIRILKGIDDQKIIELLQCKIIDHSIIFDYSKNNEMATHKLIIEFNNID